jgi:hypothetical protein
MTSVTRIKLEGEEKRPVRLAVLAQGFSMQAWLALKNVPGRD